jgi:hypothetical protein
VSKLIDNDTGKEIKKGDTVTDFRGDKWIVQGWIEPLHSGSTGRVYLKMIGPGGNWEQEFFPSVVNAQIVGE